MPIYNRRTLRRSLGRYYLNDTVLGTTSGSWGTQAGSMNIIDSSKADPTASGEELYHRHWMRLLGSAGFIQDVRVGSFNTGSGAFLTAVTTVTAIFSGMPFEVHALISPVDKDEVIDEAIKDVRIQQEYPIWSIEDGHVYSLGSNIQDILDVRYFSTPTDSLNLGEHKLDWWKYEVTATGNQLRINPSLPASYQLILNALLEVSLGAGDLATVNLISPKPILWSAAARCLWMIEQQAPAKEAEVYAKRRQQAAREATRLYRRLQPKITRKIMLDEVW